jgi:hypothetical protein
MKLKIRIYITLSFVLILTFVVLETLSYKRTHAESVREVSYLAEQIRGVLMATRRVYHHQFVKSGIPLTRETMGFLPAFALSRISKDFPNWSDSGLSFNNVSDRPRNSENAADEIEHKAMQFFREHPKKESHFVAFQNSLGKPYYHYARPIWVEKYCLKCHGNQSDAPPTIKNSYSTSFGYKVGELRGIMSIKIPATSIKSRIMNEFLQDLVIHLIALLSVILLLGMLIHRHITSPLNTMNQAMDDIVSGESFEKLEDLEGDFARIGTSLNSLASELHRYRLMFKAGVIAPPDREDLSSTQGEEP